MLPGSSGKELSRKPNWDTPLACSPNLLPVAWCTCDSWISTKPSWTMRGPVRQKPLAGWQSRKVEGVLVIKAVKLWYQPWTTYFWISLMCERNTLLFFACHCYFAFWLYAAELNVNWYIWLIRPRLMIWPRLSSLTLSCAPVPLDHCLLPALVYCQVSWTPSHLRAFPPVVLCLECSSSLPG